ncbi:MAG: hypothetical protein HY000_31245, partial [Planctomycetes bacterium]|nr:hypothetical protein [Planctomycetota bacterium]
MPRTQLHKRFAFRPVVERLEERRLLAVTDLPLLHQADLQYLGAFRLPKAGSDGSTLGSGGWALAFNPQNNSL